MELRTIDRVWFLPSNARALSARAWDFNRNEWWRIYSESNGALLLARAILKELNGEKRPEKTWVDLQFMTDLSSIIQVISKPFKTRPTYPIILQFT